MGSPRHVPLGLSALVVLGSCARLALVYPALPAVVASHFDASGTPDGHQSRLAFALSSLGVQLGLLLLFAGMPWCLRKLPRRLINMPNRDYWLSPERAELSIGRVTGYLDWFALATLALMAAVFELVVRANLRRAPLENASVWVLFALFLLLALAWSVWLLRAFRLPAPTDGARQQL